MSYQEYGVGATTVGIRGKDFVVLASDKRVSYGGFIVSRAGRKVFKVKDYIGIACAGFFADMQAIWKILVAEINYYEVNIGKRIRVKSAARLLATILYSNKQLPYISEILIGGIDEDGTSHLYVMDPLGSLIEDDYAALGSGAPIAIGLLESRYNKDMSWEDARKLAIEAIRVAIERDAITGDGIDVLVIRRDKDKVRAHEETITIAR